MKTHWRKEVLIALATLSVFSLFVYVSWLPEKRYRERCEIFCDSIKHLHGFYDVAVEEKALPMQAPGIGYVDWIITLRGVIYPRENSREFAKGFSYNVASYHSAFIDSITIIYADHSTIIRKDGFANSELTEK